VLPWIAIFAALASFFLFSRPSEVPHELSWARDQADGAGMGLGVWWYLYVGRTIFLTLLLAWLWRLALLFMLFKRIAGLELSMVPTHPDRCAGLGFMARIPVMFVPVVLGISSVFASGWAHQVVYHDVTIGFPARRDHCLRRGRAADFSLAICFLPRIDAPHEEAGFARLR
jgi:hypothetical protein